MSRAAGLTAAVPPALGQGEDDALVDGAAFQLAVGLGGLLHRHGCVRAQAEPPIGQQSDRLIQGTGSTAGRGLRQRDAEACGGRVGQGDDPIWPARAIASARTPGPAASNTASTGPARGPGRRGPRRSAPGWLPARGRAFRRARRPR